METPDKRSEILSIFNTLHKKYYRRCVLYARSYTGDYALSEDFASEAMIKLWVELDKGRKVDSPGAFLMTVLKNMLLDHFRHEQIKAKTHQDILSHGMSEADLHIRSLEATDPNQLFASDVEKIVHDTLARLPEQSRRIFMLSRTELKTNREIAEMTGISIKGVEYHISKVIGELRKTLKDYLPLLAFFL